MFGMAFVALIGIISLILKGHDIRCVIDLFPLPESEACVPSLAKGIAVLNLAKCPNGYFPFHREQVFRIAQRAGGDNGPCASWTGGHSRAGYAVFLGQFEWSAVIQRLVDNCRTANDLVCRRLPRILDYDVRRICSFPVPQRAFYRDHVSSQLIFRSVFHYAVLVVRGAPLPLPNDHLCYSSANNRKPDESLKDQMPKGRPVRGTLKLVGILSTGLFISSCGIACLFWRFGQWSGWQSMAWRLVACVFFVLCGCLFIAISLNALFRHLSQSSRESASSGEDAASRTCSMNLLSTYAWHIFSPFNGPLSPIGDRPASWRRRRFINASRAQKCWSSILPRPRLVCTVDAPSGSQQAFPDPLRRGDFKRLGCALDLRPIVVTHAEVAFRGVPGGRASASTFDFNRLFHVPIIWVPIKNATRYFMCGQIKRDSLQWTQRLGVMEPNKKPRSLLITDSGAKNTPAFAGCVLDTCILSESAIEGDAVTARKDFRIVRDKFANDSGLPFGRLLSREYVLNVLESEGHYFRSRVFCPLVVLWGWLSQCLSQDKSLRETVSRILAHRVSTGLPTISASSASYSEARTRFPESAMQRMAKEIGRKVHDSADDSWSWRGREVFLVDGTGLTMADTPENQLKYPQVSSRPAGLGFPIMRAVAIISLPTGAVVDFGIAKHEGKGTGEGTLLRSMIGNVRPESVLVADRLFPGYATVAALQNRGVELVSMSHHVRQVDFRRGHQLGPKDHIVEWHRSKYNGQSNHGDYRAHQALPETILMREFEIEIDNRTGGKEKAIIVTTLTDPSIPQKEISDLYWSRWNCELDIRSIKHALHMNVLRCKTPSMVRKEIWCHLLAYNLLRGTMTEAAKRQEIRPRQLSVKGTMQAVESFTAPMMAIDGNQAIYDAFLSTVSAHRVGNRP